MGNHDWVRIVLRSIIPSSIELPESWIARGIWTEQTMRFRLMENVMPSLLGRLCAWNQNWFEVNNLTHNSKLSIAPSRGPIILPHFSRMTYQLCLRKMSGWPTPMKGQLIMRCYSAERDGIQPVSQEGAMAVPSESEIAANDEDSKLEVIYLPTDFDWHKHIAMGSFYHSSCLLKIHSTPLLQYVSWVPMMELRPIYGDPSGKSELFVKDIAKGHIYSLMDSLDELHRQDLCIEDLDHSKVVICDGVAKFSPDITLVLATDARRTANWVELEDIISGTLLGGKKLPYSMKHLLTIMKTEPLTSIPYMKSHVGLMRQVNKTASFMRFNDSLHGLRLQSESRYMLLLGSLHGK